MSRLQHYLDAADRDNTRRSYASALRHFEVEWGGLLPATPESVAEYLAAYAGHLSSDTLRHRVAALSRWHADQGFADPTKAILVRRALKGIGATHPSMPQSAPALVLADLQCTDASLEQLIAAEAAPVEQLRALRDRALVRIGFWRGFRSDELTRMAVEHVEVVPNEGLTVYLPRSKGDRSGAGRLFQCPVLPRLDPVAAYVAWIEAAGIESGPVFRKIDKCGNLGAHALHPGSLNGLLRRRFRDAGIVGADSYSSHSLRRGFAGWARAAGWDLKDVMTYVGWRDIKSALRYYDARTDLKARFEAELGRP